MTAFSQVECAAWHAAADAGSNQELATLQRLEAEADQGLAELAALRKMMADTCTAGT